MKRFLIIDEDKIIDTAEYNEDNLSPEQLLEKDGYTMSDIVRQTDCLEAIAAEGDLIGIFDAMTTVFVTTIVRFDKKLYFYDRCGQINSVDDSNPECIMKHIPFTNLYKTYYKERGYVPDGD